ncbi:hypothetical protein HAX54_024679 [Datura stramonium]|uniref:Phytocyanin domain-containing protein n=1 Tax=Datura stramonium TaxID=4076 RepID=A0ABS8RGI6_DATST|nr:hypothetical protein [Datura stramonium]
MVTRMKIARIALVLVAILAVLPGNTVAVDHVVGDSMGWGIPSGGPATYANWASQRTFRVGDTLVFNFATGAHDVAKVTKSAYDSCSSTGPVTLITVGPANITLNSTGTEYFICTFGQHCSAGQKLAINVTSASTPTPSPAPSPATSPTPSPVPTPTPTPPLHPLLPRLQCKRQRQVQHHQLDHLDRLLVLVVVQELHHHPHHLLDRSHQGLLLHHPRHQQMV